MEYGKGRGGNRVELGETHEREGRLEVKWKNYSHAHNYFFTCCKYIYRKTCIQQVIVCSIVLRNENIHDSSQNALAVQSYQTYISTCRQETNFHADHTEVAFCICLGIHKIISLKLRPLTCIRKNRVGAAEAPPHPGQCVIEKCQLLLLCCATATTK